VGAVDLFSIQDRDDVADDRIARVGRFVVRPCAPAVPDRIDIQYAIVRQELVVSPAGPAGLVHLQSGHHRTMTWPSASPVTVYAIEPCSELTVLRSMLECPGDPVALTRNTAPRRHRTLTTLSTGADGSA
jgi:hypothetical protein